jgi:hypothetical protein
MRPAASLPSVLVLSALALAGCSGGVERQNVAPFAPISPTRAVPTPTASGPASDRSAQGAVTTPGATNGVAVVLLPPEPIMGALDVAFPGRNESFQFRQELETKYRDGLRRPPTSSYVDVEGDLVWTQEYLRYRVNQCGHVEATQKVLAQIDGGPPSPVCGSSSSSSVPFPPRNESFDFRQELERKYRDGLRRQPSSTYVDVEGAIVWTQEYLRYRVNACGHVASSQKVMDQIDGRGIGPPCNADLSGVWDGEITNFFNSPFVVDMVQSGSSLSGSYKDRHDTGSWDGSINGDRFRGHAYFGDTGHVFEGRWDGGDVISGDATLGGGIGRRSFEMHRRR